MPEAPVPLTRAKPISMKSHPAYNEKWLQTVIAADPTILGLGDLEVKDVERRQLRSGRLDLLLSDPEAATRYEVEIQLGATDESHIIRTIEYWDIEKNRYPAFDHVAVIVAEDVTSRFLNVISLLNRSVPLIAIQLNAWDIAGATTLIATKVLDLLPAGDDEDDEPGSGTDRAYWAARSNPASMKIADDLLALVHKATGDTRLALKYNKHYIGLARDGVAHNFVTVSPRKAHARAVAELRIPRSDEFSARLDEAGIDVLRYDTAWRAYIVRLTDESLEQHRDILTEVIQRASGMRPAADVESE